jgi:OHS family lactose permease-like MFS transporter
MNIIQIRNPTVALPVALLTARQNGAQIVGLCPGAFVLGYAGLLAGAIMSVRIVGSSFATPALEVVILKTLHMFEVRFSATIYLVCFCFFKQLAMIFMSIFAGNMYESIGFQGACLVLGLVALGFTLLSAFTLSGPGPISLLRRREAA